MCTRPNIGIPNGFTEKGKIKYRFVPYSSAIKSNILQCSSGSDMFELVDKDSRIIKIPCGKCQECKMAYAKQWSNRCMLELKYHKSSYFVTFTYDDEHLPKSEKGVPTLKKSDMVKFFKDLRAYLDYRDKPKISFFMAGEYGSMLFRPHYHAIIFGLELDDLQFYKRSDLQDTYFTSPTLDKLWSKGFVIVGEVTPQSCSYVARYCSKKIHDRAQYEELGIVPEYTNMSRRPSIGLKAISDIGDDGALVINPDKLKSFYEFTSVPISTENGAILVTPPRFFDKKLEEVDPLLLEELKNKRTLSMAYKGYSELLDTSKDELEMLETKELNLERRLRSLVRDL